MSREWRVIARVEKAHGIKGEVVTVPVDGLPFLMKKGLRTCLVPPDLDTDRYQTVVNVEDGRRGQLVAFSDIHGLGDAEKLAGKFVLAPEDELEFGEGEYDASSFIGLSVLDEKYGLLGEIVDVMTGPVQDVLVVDGSYGEVLIPLVDVFVLGVSEDGTVSTAVPNGLVEEE